MNNKPAAAAPPAKKEMPAAAAKKNDAGSNADAPLTRKQRRFADLLQRNEVDRLAVEEYADAQRGQNKPVILRFALMNGKLVTGVLVEVGTYVYVVDVKVEDKPTRMILNKHAVSYVLLGGE